MRRMASLLILSCALPQYACAAPFTAEEQGAEKVPQMAEEKGESGKAASLPYARGHSFETLDAYLAYLEESNGPIDLPWWREISPGVYRKQTSMAGGPEPETATRAELEERFGFAKSE